MKKFMLFSFVTTTLLWTTNNFAAGTPASPALALTSTAPASAPPAPVARAASVKTPSTALDRIVAVVNDDIITQTQLNQELDIAKKQLQSTNAPLPNDAQLRKQVLQQLIDHRLQLQAAHRAGMDINAEEIDKAIATIAQRNHLTVAQLRQAVIQQGTTYATYRKQIGEQILISKLQQQVVGAGITVTRQDIDNFLHSGQNINLAASEYRLRDILIPLPNAPSPAQIAAARAKADNLVKQLRAGADFQKMAIAQSSDTTDALNGGDLGWRHLAELPDIFTQPIIKMKVNDIAGPIHAPNGFHILKLVETKISTQQLTGQQIRQLIFERKLQEKIQAWLQQLRGTVYIKIMS